MKRRPYRKRDFPLDQIRRYLEPGPIVLVSSAWQGRTNIMTMGWHMMMGFSPALFACYIWEGNHSFTMLRRSRETVCAPDGMSMPLSRSPRGSADFLPAVSAGDSDFIRANRGCPSNKWNIPWSLHREIRDSIP